jgi:hypothetical protein
MAFTQIFQDGLNAFLLVPRRYLVKSPLLQKPLRHVRFNSTESPVPPSIVLWESQPRDTAYELHADVVMVSVSLKLKSECKQCKHAYR